MLWVLIKSTMATAQKICCGYSLEVPRWLHKNICCGYSLEAPQWLHENKCCGYLLEVPRITKAFLMSTHDIYFHAEIRKILVIFGWKNFLIWGAILPTYPSRWMGHAEPKSLTFSTVFADDKLMQSFLFFPENR